MADKSLASKPVIVTRKDAKARGLVRYFTGKPCKYGHVDYRYVGDCACAACCRVKASNQRASDPTLAEKVKAHNNERYRTDPEFRAKVMMRSAEWSANNKNKCAQYSKEYYQANKEKASVNAKFRRETKKLDPEWVQKEKIRNRARHKANPEAKRSYVRRRRALLRDAEGSHNHHDINDILIKQKHKCAYCRASIKGGYDVDHIIPLARGGSNWPKNLQCLCPECNGKKWCKDPIDYARETGRLI